MASKKAAKKSPRSGKPVSSRTPATAKKSARAAPVKLKKNEVVDLSPDAAIAQVRSLATTQAASVLALKVVDDASLAVANEMLVEFKKAKKVLEEKRTFFLGPLKESLKRLEHQFKIPAQLLYEADQGLRAKVVAFIEAKQRSVEAQKVELVAKAEEAAAAGDSEGALEAATAAVTIAEPTKTMHTDTSRVSTRDVWDWEVLDYGAVPHEFFTLDEKKIRVAILSGQTSIPGIRAFKRATLSVGGL